MRAPGAVCQTTQSIAAPQTIDMYSNGATVAAGASRNASVTRCWPAQPARPSRAIQGRSAFAIAIQPGAASAPEARASRSRNQNTIDAVDSVADISRTMTTTIAQAMAAPKATSPARLTKPDAAGFSITSTPASPTNIAAQT